MVSCRSRWTGNGRKLSQRGQPRAEGTPKSDGHADDWIRLTASHAHIHTPPIPSTSRRSDYLIYVYYLWISLSGVVDLVPPVETTASSHQIILRFRQDRCVNNFRLLTFILVSFAMKIFMNTSLYAGMSHNLCDLKIPGQLVFPSPMFLRLRLTLAAFVRNGLGWWIWTANLW